MKMQIGNLTIQLIEKLTVREYQEISRISNKFQKELIDEIEMGNQLARFVIKSINGEEEKEKILNLILDIESIEDYALLNEAVANKIQELTATKKKS